MIDGETPPAPRPPAKFRGGVSSRFWRGNWPFGHLEFDETSIRMWGTGLDFRADRREVSGVRVWVAAFLSEVTVVALDGSESKVSFTGDARAIRAALWERGWPVFDG